MKTETSGLLDPSAQHVRKRSTRRRQVLWSAGTMLVLGSTLIVGSFLTGSTLLQSMSRSSNRYAEESNVPAITTAKNLKWTRCEEDETMFCTVFT